MASAVFLFAGGGTTLAQDAPAAPPVPLLTYCAPPVKPSCVDQDATYATPQTSKNCQLDVERFVQTVFTYRQCVNAELERTVRETNQIIGRYRCRSTDGKNCP